MNIYEKLSEVQNELVCPKEQYNPFGKYNYRSCEDILAAAKPLAKKNGAMIYVSDSIEAIGERMYVKAIATFTDCETGETVQTHAFAREDETKKGMDGAQITGAASSYARKYALNGLLCIDDIKDADAAMLRDSEEQRALLVEIIEHLADGDMSRVDAFVSRKFQGKTLEKLSLQEVKDVKRLIAEKLNANAFASK